METIAKELCTKLKHDMKLYTTSAKTGTNMENVFEEITIAILNQISEERQ